MPQVLHAVFQGPLAPHVEVFAEGLLRQGYTKTSAGQHLCFLAHLDRWLISEGLGLSDLSESVLLHYLVQRRAAGYVEYRSMLALRPMLDYLSPLGVLPAPELAVVGPVDVLLGEYREFLLTERGLASGTGRGYVDAIRPFLTGRVHDDRLVLDTLTAADVTTFVRTTCPGRAVGSAKLIVTALRSLLNWLYLTGRTSTSLAAAAPAVAGRRLAGLPKALEPAQLRRLLKAPGRRTRTGRRDYAILLLLARLGLRAGEVARLELADIDWRRGELTVIGKGSRAERLPLPADVGAALASYLRRGRPVTAQGRSVFVRVHAPHQALTTGGITAVVSDNAERAGLGELRAHRLRHTAATEMLVRRVASDATAGGIRRIA